MYSKDMDLQQGIKRDMAHDVNGNASNFTTILMYILLLF